MRWRTFLGFAAALQLGTAGCCKLLSTIDEREMVADDKQDFVGSWAGVDHSEFALSRFGHGHWYAGSYLSGNMFLKADHIHLDITDLMREAESIDIPIDEAPHQEGEVWCLKLDGHDLVKVAALPAELVGTWEGPPGKLAIASNGFARWEPREGQPIEGIVQVQDDELRLRTCKEVLKSFPLEKKPAVKNGVYVIVIAGVVYTRMEKPSYGDDDD